MASAKAKHSGRGPVAFARRMGLAGLAGGVAGVGNVLLSDWPGVAGLLLTVLVNIVAMGICLIICLLWWRDIDEAAREAHKWAWWWGGCSGMAVGAVFLLTALYREGDAGLAGLSSNEVFASGMLLFMVSQILGYGVAWLVWWGKRR